jgi:hypothetical protein
MKKMSSYVHDPEKCFWCGTTLWAVGLEEHHLWRGNQRSQSPSVWVCNKCHKKATFNKDFEIKLQNIYLYQYEQFRFEPGTIASYGDDKYNPRRYRRDG